MPDPLVSIIVPTKNSAANLEACLLSIKAQTYKNIEIIVVVPEGGAEFETIIQKYNFRLVCCHQGKSAARNAGSEISRGEYLLHLDDDMVLTTNVVSECVDMSTKRGLFAVAIPETEVRSKGLYNKIRILEKTIASGDAYIEAPRFIKKDVFNLCKQFDVTLDPIDEGDLKAKLEERKISYATTKAVIVLSCSNRMSSLNNRWRHMYQRGQKTPLFNLLHPYSNQFSPGKRFQQYIRNSELVFGNPVVGVALLMIKAVDLVILKIGSLCVGVQDKKIISEIKNKIIFEKEAGLYQKEFYENTVGAQFVDREEKKLVEKYLKKIDKDSYIKILDIGSGGGRWCELLLNYFPNAEVVGCDLSEGMVVELNKKFMCEPRFAAVVGDMQNLPFNDNEFDMVISVRALKYSDDYHKVFDEVKRVLKPYGRSIIELPYYNFIYRIIKKISLFGKLSEYANRINLLTKKEIIKKLKNSDFIINDLRIEFSIPSTFYKNTYNIIFLNILKIIDFLLPKYLFGRSIFFELLNDKPTSSGSSVDDLISVIVVNWNGKKWLNNCLSSLAVQTYKNIEVILVDNDSDDDSVDFVKTNYPRAVVIRGETNLGFAAGNNLGISKAKGKYILLLNNDTWIETKLIEKLHEYLLVNNLDVVSAKEIGYRGALRPYSDKRTIDIFGHPFFEKGNVKIFYLPAICIFFSKKMYEITGGLDPNFFMYFEETDWFWRLNLLKKGYGLVSDAVVNHAGSGTADGGMQYKTFLWRNQNNLQMLLKNYSLKYLILILPVYFLQNIFEMVFFLGTLKPSIAYSYVRSWWFNMMNLRTIINKRKWVQNNRRIDDHEIIEKMFFGFAKFRHLLIYFKRQNDEKSL